MFFVTKFGGRQSLSELQSRDNTVLYIVQTQLNIGGRQSLSKLQLQLQLSLWNYFFMGTL